MSVFERNKPYCFGVTPQKEIPRIEYVFITYFGKEKNRLERMYLVGYSDEKFTEPFTGLIFHNQKNNEEKREKDYLYLTMPDDSTIEFSGQIVTLDEILSEDKEPVGILLKKYLNNNEYYIRCKVEQTIQQKVKEQEFQKQRFIRQNPQTVVTDNDIDEITKRLCYLNKNRP